MDADRPIRILHLSDIHFRVGKAWDADPVLRSLTWFVAAEVDAELLPDFVVFTGDLAFSGEAEEYVLARDWLDHRLWPALGGDFPRDRLLVVPGNHDVDRSMVSRGVRLMQNGLLNACSQDDIAALLSDDDTRSIMLRRHAAYMDFVADWYGEKQPLPWWQRVIHIRGTSLHIAGLDTAWMSCGEEDRGRLLLGRYQLSSTVVTEEAEVADWRIAMMHHPWQYLAKFDQQPSRLYVHQHCDVLLRGHLHEHHARQVVPPDPSRQCLELAAGCLYEASEYPNAFQWIELAPAEKRVRVLFRAWLHKAWKVDRSPACPKGYADFTLVAKPAPRSRLAQSAAPKIPPDYLAWLRQRCAAGSLLGQDPKQHQAFTLSDIYVPALTSPDAAAISEEALSGRREQLEEKRPVTLIERIDEASLYVSAPAGAGKTTFCRWAVLQSIQYFPTAHSIPVPTEFQEPVPKNLYNRLPLLVRLRDFASATVFSHSHGLRQWTRSDLERALIAWIDQSPPPGLNGAVVRDHLAAGSTFLLLDGLDEVAVSESSDSATVYPRSLLLSGLADALPAWEKAGNRMLLTSSPYGLDKAGLFRLSLAHAPLEPLPRPLQDLFVSRWFSTLGRPDKAESLLMAMRDRYELAPLIENPMLLTAVCVLYDRGHWLPEDRHKLYNAIVDGVLQSRYPGGAGEREPVLRQLEAIAYSMHTGDTGEPGEVPRQTPAVEISWVEIEKLLARFAQLNPAYEKGAVAVQREELLTRSGLLLPRPDERAAFYHLSFQEYLAAQRMERTTKDLYPVFRMRGAVPEWRPTLLFLFAARIAKEDHESGLALLTRLAAQREPGLSRGTSALAALIAEALQIWLSKDYKIPNAVADQFRQFGLRSIENEIELQAREALGLMLGRLEDTRIFSLRDSAAYVGFPAEDYPFGEERSTVKVASFRLGRYPVTNKQYRAFMDDAGYANQRWWSDAGWLWLQKENITEPRYWHDRRFNGPNQPVVGVSYWEAEACATWAGGRLPFEQEWEAAARGTVGREYPWGNDWSDGICNTVEAMLGSLSPVGIFPRSRSPDGVEDLAGNVLEWCQSAFPSSKDEGARRAAGVLRGGSWRQDWGSARCTYRMLRDSSIRSDLIGFRVVQSPTEGDLLSNRVIADPNMLFQLDLPLLPIVEAELKRKRRLKRVLGEAGVTASRLDRAVKYIRSSADEQASAIAERLNAEVISRAQAAGLYTCLFRLPTEFILNIREMFLVLWPTNLSSSDVIELLRRWEGLKNRLTVVVVDDPEASSLVLRTAADRSTMLAALGPADLTRIFLADEPLEMFARIVASQVPLARISPYQTRGGLENEKGFFGRSELLAHILNRGRGNYLIVGGRQVGKSSLLKAIQRRVGKQGGTLCHYLSLGYDPIVPRLAEVLGLAADTPHEQVFAALGAPGSGNPRLVLIDEADVFVERDRDAGYSVLNRLRNLSEEGRCNFILAGFWKLYELASLDYYSPIKNFGETLIIGSLEKEACRDLAMRPMASLNLDWEASLVEELIWVTGQRANLIAIACDKILKEIRLTERTISYAALQRALQSDDMIDAFDGWKNLTTNELENQIDRIIVYSLVDHDKFTRRDVTKILLNLGVSCRSMQIERSIRRLLLSYIFRRQNEYYGWSVPLFRDSIVRVEAEAYLSTELTALRKGRQ